MHATKLTMILVGLTLTTFTNACVTSGSVIENPGFKPISLSDGDCLTESTARKILAHNEFGEKMNYWKSSKGCVPI